MGDTEDRKTTDAIVDLACLFKTCKCIEGNQHENFDLGCIEQMLFVLVLGSCFAVLCAHAVPLDTPLQWLYGWDAGSIFPFLYLFGCAVYFLRLQNGWRGPED